MQPSEQTWKFSRRQRQLLLGSSLAAAGAYFAYRIYKSDSLAAIADLRARLKTGLDCYSQAFLAASESSSTILQDLHSFLTSDSDEVPQSLRQLAKLAKSKDVTDATSLLAAAAVQGVLSGTSGGLAGAGGVWVPQPPDRQILERILDVLTTERGANLVTLAVSMACRSSVQAMYEFGGTTDSGQPFWLATLLSFGTSPGGERLYTTCVGAFVREGMKVYMGSMDGVNPWEDFFGSLCKPEMQPALERLTRVFVNEVIVSYVKRSRYTTASAQRAQAAVKADGKLLKNGTARHSMASPAAKHVSLQSLTAAEGAPGEVCLSAAPSSKDGSHRLKQAEDGAHPEIVHISSHSASNWLPLLAQAARVPEVRGLIVSLAGTATAEGVRSSFLTARELMTSGAGGRDLHVLPVASPRQLGVLLLCFLLPIILYLAGKRSMPL